jgi:hypothetical protein
LVAQVAQPFQLRPHHERLLRFGHGARKPGLDPPGRRSRGRIHAQPTARGEKDLGPGVRVGLAHGDDAIDRVEIAALVAGDHARRHASRAHQEHEGRGEVLAESGLGREQEFIHRIGAEQRRLEGIEVAPLAQESERAGEHIVVAVRAGAPLCGQRERLRVESGRQQQRAAQLARVLLQPRGRGDHRRHVIAQPRPHQRAREQLPVGGEAGVFRHARRGLQREQPVAVVRLEHHAVTVGRAPACRRGEAREKLHSDAPGAAVEVPQHRAAPVAQRRRWRVALELGAERDRVGKREARKAARAHRLRKPAHAGIGVLRQAPQRPLHARKQHEQRERRGRRMRQQYGRGLQVGARRAAGRAKADQRRREGEQRRCHEQRRGDRLCVQEIRDDQEIAEKSGRRGVAVGARLEQLQAREQHQQQDAGLAAEKRAVFDPHAEHRHRGHADHQPARGQRRPVDRVMNAPAVQAQGEQREPPGGAQRVWRDDQHE